MSKRTFTVTHARAKKPLTIEGYTLAQALKKARLNPDIWRLVEEVKTPAESNFGNTD